MGINSLYWLYNTPNISIDVVYKIPKRRRKEGKTLDFNNELIFPRDINGYYVTPKSTHTQLLKPYYVYLLLV